VQQLDCVPWLLLVAVVLVALLLVLVLVLVLLLLLLLLVVETMCSPWWVLPQQKRFSGCCIDVSVLKAAWHQHIAIIQSCT
jgi:hypothetical protein